MKKNKKLSAIFFFVLLFLGFLLILPSLTPLFKKNFFKMHDYTHVARLAELDIALKEGHLPPRLSKNLGWGYGMPLFQFYAPLPYYLSELFHLLGASFSNSIKICFGLTFFISFLGMFFLAKKFWGKWGAFLASLAFVYSPYRAVDFYVRGALGELFAISLIPWVLWALTEVVDKKGKKKTVSASLLLGFFLLSHTVLNLICFPLFLLFSGFYMIVTERFKKSFTRVISSFALGVGLASFFLLPAFFEKKFSQVDKLIGGYSHYSHHFLYFRQFIWGNWGYGGSVDGIEDGLSFHLGKIHLGLAASAVIFSLLTIFWTRKIRKKNLLVAFFATLLAVLAFLSTYRAKPVWDALPLMVFIQFPWRLNSFIIVLVAFLAGASIYYLAKLFPKLAFFVFSAAAILLLQTNIKYFKPQEYITPSDYYYTNQELVKKAMSDIIPDFIPIWVEKKPEQIALADYEIISGEPEIEVVESKTHKLVLKVKKQKPADLQINKFYFPGWKVFIDDKEALFKYKENNGIITVSLPEGKYTLKLIFTKTPIRKLAEMVSLTSLFLVIILYSLPTSLFVSKILKAIGSS